MIENRTFFGRVAATGPEGIHLWVADRIMTFPLPPGLATLPETGAFVRLDLAQGQPTLTVVQAATAAGSADTLRWRKPDASGRTRMRFLADRHAVLRATERWFDDHAFLQIASPTLVPAVNPEAQFHFIPAGPGWLATSPELQMKRMLAGGFERIVSIGPCYRGHELSARHNPEFTMLEWYRAWARLPELLDDLEALIRSLAPSAPAWQADDTLLLADGRKVRMGGAPWPRRTVTELLRETLAIDIERCSEADDLFERGRQKNFFAEEQRGERFEQLFSRLWEACEAALAPDTPLFVTDWPAPLASLAALDPERPWIACRAELLIGGLEVANGFTELTAAAEQRRRFESELAVRRETGLPLPAADEAFLLALEGGMPPAAGMAAGFDRLVMLLSGAATIRDVLPFSADELLP